MECSSTLILVQVLRGLRYISTVALLMFATFVVVPHQVYASSQADSLRKVTMRLVRDTNTVNALNQYGMILHETYPDSTRTLALEALRLADSLRDWKGKAQSLNNIGVSFFIQNNYEKALEYYLQALTLREKIADIKGVAGTLNNVGMVYRDRKEFSTALSYYFRAMRLNDSLKNNVFFVRNLNNIGVAYENLNQLDSALLYHRRSLEIKKILGDKAGISASLRNIGKVYVRQKRYNDALTTLREALSMPETGKQVRALVLLDIAQVYEETEQTNAAVNNVEASMMLGRELGSALILQNGHEALARLFTQIQDHKRALENYQRFITLRDSLFNESSTRRLAALQTNYEIDRQRAQIDLLTKETELQSLVRNGLVAGFVLMAVLLGVSVIAYRNKRRSNAQLRETNAEILRQQNLLEQQAVEIQIANTSLSEKNIELEHSNETLSTLNNEKNEIMGIVAHDLKNPIGAVRGLAELMQTGYIEGEQIKEVSGQIFSTAERMLDLVKNLLDVNHLDSGMMQFQRQAVHLQPIIETTIWQYKETAAQKGITIHFNNEAEQGMALADEQAVVQVLDNLISNAVKYSPHGKNIRVRMKSERGNRKQEEVAVSSLSPLSVPLNISSLPLSAFLRIEVQDEGQGISPADMKKLFGKFARLSARPTGGEHSTGLGLSIVKKMVEAMDGRVWCESEIDQGATFIVELPKV